MSATQADNLTTSEPVRAETQLEAAFGMLTNGTVAVDPDQGFSPTSALAAQLTADELTDIMGAFMTATDRLQRAHESLQSEVGRLQDDLTDANQQLERSRQLAGLGQLAAGIAHEIRNPLSSVRMYASMLIEDLDDRPEEQQKAQRISQAVLALDEVVGHVLSFARDVQLNPMEVTAGELVALTLDACEGILKMHPNVSVTCDHDALDACDLFIDVSLVSQAMVNIVRNALEAMDGEGVLEFTVDATLNARGKVALFVRDSGPGLDDEVAATAFDPFMTTRGSGTGLGLAIVQRIIDAHAGTVSLQNRQSARGAEVVMRLPANSAALLNHTDSNCTEHPETLGEHSS